MDSTSWATFSQLIGQLGFPIFVAVYLMIKGSKDSQENKQMIQALTIQSQNQTKAIEELTNAVNFLARQK